MTDRTINWVFRATDKTTAAFRSVDSKLNGITKSLKTFAGFAGFAAVAAGIGSIAGKLSELSGSLKDASEKLGISVESLQVLKVGAENAGSSFESLQTALAFNTKLVSASADANSAAAATLRELGIDAKAIANIPIDKRFAVFAEQLSKIESPAERLTLILKTFGKSAGDLAPFFAEGAEGIDKLTQKMVETNQILSVDQVKAIDEATKKWEQLGRQFDALSAGPLAALASRLLGILDYIDLVKKGADFGNITNFEGLKKPPALPPVLDSSAIIGAPKPGSAIDESARIKAAKDAAKELERITKEIAAVFEKTRTPQEEYYAGLERIADLQSKGLDADTAQRAIDQLAQTYAKSAVAAYDATVSGAAYNDMVADAARLVEETLTPLEKYWRQLELIDKLQSKGLVTPEVATRGKNQAAQDAAKELQAVAKEGEKVESQTDRLLKDLTIAANGFARDLTDVFFDATSSIGDMFKNLAETIAKTIFTKTISEPLIAGILGAFGGPRAAGGPVKAGTTYLVGEEGPELFVSNQAGRIVPTHKLAVDTRQAARSSGPILPSHAPMLERASQPVTAGVTTFKAPNLPVPQVLNKIIASTYLVGKKGPETFTPKTSGTVVSSDETLEVVQKILHSFRVPPFGGYRAMGGSVSAGSAYVVGEKGPEVFVSNSDGRIIPATKGDSAPVQVVMNIASIDPQTAAQTIASHERLITGMIRRATIRAGRRPALA